MRKGQCGRPADEPALDTRERIREGKAVWMTALGVERLAECKLLLGRWGEVAGIAPHLVEGSIVEGALRVYITELRALIGAMTNGATAGPGAGVIKIT
jgi:hypothetical protein